MILTDKIELNRGLGSSPISFDFKMLRGMDVGLLFDGYFPNHYMMNKESDEMCFILEKRNHQIIVDKISPSGVQRFMVME